MRKMIFGAIALTLAVPGLAQTASAEPKAGCCEKMKAEGKECCCKDMAGKGHDEHGKPDHQPKAGDAAAHDGHGEHDDAYVAEATLKHGPWTAFARAELTENRELVEDPDEHGPAFKVGKISLGAVHDFKVAENLSFGVGGLFAVNCVPDGLAQLYGGHNPTGAIGFVRLKLD